MAIKIISEDGGKLPDGRDIRITTVSGALNAATVMEFEDTIMSALDQNVGVQILDCSGMEYANSTGMGLLINLKDRFEDANSRIELCSVPDKVALVFQMLGLEAIFTPHPDRATALRAAGIGAAPKPAPPPARKEVYHVMVGPVRQGFDAQAAASALAVAVGLQMKAATAILQRAPVVLFGDVTRADVDHLRRHVARLARVGLDLRVTQKPVDHMLKVQWRGKPDVQAMFKQG